MNKIKGVFVITLVFFSMTFGAPLVQADSVVGTGSPGSCTEAALNAALNGGGTITFNCGTAPHTILLSDQKSINQDTVVDGGGRITLSGINSTRLFDVGAALTLKNIILTNGYFNGDGGAIRNNANGSLNLEGVAIQNSTATLSGGAVVSYGPMTITNSTLSGNSALNGGALYLRFAAAQTAIVDSIFSDNQATDTNGLGGAILVWDGAALTIQGTSFSGNEAPYYGGGLYNSNSAVTLENSVFSSNSGGGMANIGTAVLDGVTFMNNTVEFDGGGLNNLAGTAALTNVAFISNTAGAWGGAVNNDYSAVLSVTHGTFRGNTAHSGGGLKNIEGTVTLTDVTIEGNTAVDGGGISSWDGPARGGPAAGGCLRHWGSRAPGNGGRHLFATGGALKPFCI